MDNVIGFLETELDRVAREAAGSDKVVPLQPHREEGTLRERERRFRQLLDALPPPSIRRTRKGHYLFQRRRRGIVGPASAARHQRMVRSWKLYWPDGTPLLHADCPMALAIKDNRSVRGMEAVCERPDGTRVPFLPYPSPLHDESGRLIGAVNMLVDITERKRAEEQQSLMVRELHHR